MGKIGTTELLVVLAIVLVIFGPKALPKLGRSLGKTLGSFRKGMNDSADDDDDDKMRPYEDDEDHHWYYFQSSGKRYMPETGGDNYKKYKIDGVN